MRKRVFGKKLSRDKGARRALFRSLVRALVLHGRIVTTKAKAKAIQGQIDKLVNTAKKDNVSGQRAVLSYLGNDRETAESIVKKIAPTFEKRTSGFTRIIPLPERRGDLAQMVRLEWVKRIEEPEGKREEKKTKKGGVRKIKRVETAKKKTKDKKK